MEFRSRSNQPQPTARPTQATPAARPNFEGSDMESTTTNNASRQTPLRTAKSPKKKMIMCGLAVLALIVLLFIGTYIHRTFFSNEVAVEGNKYQAIFLTNGQVYFGHLSNVDNGYAKLMNVYYLQVQQQVQPSGNSSSSNSSQQPQVSLTKLGNELHGPEDAMYIARPQILFWENLKDDGKVVQAIKQSLNQK